MSTTRKELEGEKLLFFSGVLRATSNSRMIFYEVRVF